MTPNDGRHPSGSPPSARMHAAPPDHQIPATASRGGGDRRADGGIADLLRDLATDMKTLVRQEIELARMEIGRTASSMAKNGVWVAVGAGIGAVGGLVLVVALALGLGALLGSYWLGTLVTGLFLLAVGGLLALLGVHRIRKLELAPRRTVSTLKEDAEWAREEARDFKERLKE